MCSFITRTIEASSVCRVIQIRMSVDGSSIRAISMFLGPTLYVTRTMHAYAYWKSNTGAVRVFQGVKLVHKKFLLAGSVMTRT